MRSIKGALRKSIGKRSVTRVELETLLVEIEGMLNSRPLTFVGDDPDAAAPLTPSHFLLGRLVSEKCKYPLDTETLHGHISPEDLVLRMHVRNERSQYFWEYWSKMYLRSLPPYSGTANKNSLKVGTVVLVENEACKRLEWPLGLVQQVYPGRDGHIRAVRVRTAKGVVDRPIQRLYCLEVNERISDCPSDVLKGDNMSSASIGDTQSSPDTHSHTDPLTPDTSITTSKVPVCNQSEIKRSKYGRVLKPKVLYDA
jgi:hypothetical protein